VHVLAAYRDRLWLIGGEMGAAHYTNDLWSTEDGVRWTLIGDRLPWVGRHAAGVVEFRDKLWILGGTSSSWGTSARGDIWTIQCGSA